MIPVALSLILLLLFFAFKSVTYTLVVFSTVPLSLIGGIVALWLRGLPFSISAGVGFIALFGVAVLNGILMINHFNDLRKQTKYQMTTNKIITKGCPHLLRPVFLTGLVASLGFVPMAIAKSAGAEVQRPLATVVIGGLIVSTVLTLLVIPVFYRLVNAAPVWWKRMRKPGGKALMLLATVLLVAPATVQAQEGKVTLDEAIGIALQNHPRLKTASAAVDRLHATRGEAWEVAPTSVSYSWGQINGEYRHDNQMELTQSLGSLLTPFYKNALVSKQVTTSRYYRKMVKKEIVAEVKRAWVYYQYAVNLCSLYREQNDLASRLQQAGQLRYEQGDITLLERNMTTTLAADLRTRLMQAEEELSLASRRLTWACYADRSLLPADTALTLLPTEAAVSSASETYLNYFKSQAEEKQMMLRVERSRFFPELSLGYVRQKIAPQNGLNSWMVGVSFPVLFFPQHSRVKQAKIDAYVARIESEANMRGLDNKVEELQAILRKQSESIRYYTTGALPEADALLQSALLLFRESETDITQFVQSLNAAREIRRGYVEAVYNYNVAALELEMYTR